MIVGDSKGSESTTGRRATLDDLFRRAAVRNPDAVALLDPADRATFTDGAPRTLTFAQADRIVWTIAARLRRLGLQTDAVIGVQLPNTVESVLTLLGILRAGMIAAPLPMLWRQSEIVSALSGTGAKALITTARIGDTKHCEVAMGAAVQLFSIRHVCAFGENVPDGVTAFDELMAAAGRDVLPAIARSDNPAGHAGIITFEPTARGILPIMRNHVQLIAGGLAVFVAGGLVADIALLSATPLSSFAGLSVTLLPWLLSGGRLVLHQPFDPSAFLAAQRDQECAAIVAPGPLLESLCDLEHLRSVIALWRTPERADGAAPWRGRAAVVDVRAFGETGIVATPRIANDTIAPLALGRCGDVEPVELKRTETGTLSLRGAMIAGASLSPGLAYDGFVNTFYPCRAENGRLLISGPQPGMVGVGGYRVARADLDAVGAILKPGETITALPDAMLGRRLAAASPDRDTIAADLDAQGVNPLIASAFRPRRAA